jgi:hypothetical protein
MSFPHLGGVLKLGFTSSFVPISDPLNHRKPSLEELRQAIDGDHPRAHVMAGEERIHLFIVLQKTSVKGSLEEAESSHSLSQYLTGNLENTLAPFFNQPR